LVLKIKGAFHSATGLRVVSIIIKNPLLEVFLLKLFFLYNYFQEVLSEVNLAVGRLGLYFQKKKRRIKV
jgi:hypothetical protein